MSVTVSEVLVAARSGLAAVSSETAGYLVLGTADCLGDAPIGIASVYLDEDGAMRLDRRTEVAAGDGEAGLRTVLKKLLETGRSPAPALLRVASAGEKRGVRRLITEIEAALIPVNRAAARRALARLHRDVLRGKVAGKLASTGEEILSPEPSALPPKAVPAAPAVPVVPIVETLSTEGPTPVVPSVEPVPIVVAHELEELAPVETLEPSPAPWVDNVPEATPFLGSVLTAPREVVAPEPLAYVEIDAPDTDRAPPVELDVPSDTPRFAAETALLGTYGVSPVVPVVNLDIPVEVAFEESPDEHADRASIEHAGAAIVEIFDDAFALEDGAAMSEFDAAAEPELVPFEPVFAAETAAARAPLLPEEREARDALEAALLDFGDSDEVSVPAESVDPAGEPFVPMFEFLPEGVPGEQTADIDGPPTTDEVPELAIAMRGGSAAEEPDGNLEALIDEALAVLPEAVEEEPLPDSAPMLPRVSAVRYESATVPGLGFVNIALVAANIQDVVQPVVARFDADEPPVAELESVEPPVAELESVEPPVAELESVEPPVAECRAPSVAEFATVEPAIAEFEAMFEALDADVFEPAVAELAADVRDVLEPVFAFAEAEVDEPVADEPVADEPAADEPAADEPAADEPAADEPAADEYSAVEYAPVEYAVRVVQAALPEFDVAEPAVEDSEPAVEDSEPAVEDSEPAVEDSEPAFEDSEPAFEDSEPAFEDSEPAFEDSEPAFEDSEPAALESAVEYSSFEPEVVEPEDEPVVIVPAAEAPSYRPRRSDVADLVAAFVVAESRSLSELSRELKRIAGIGATPAPPEVASAPVRRKVSSAR